MKIYSDYTKTIQKALKTGSRRRPVVLSGIRESENFEKAFDFGEFLVESKKTNPLPSLQSIVPELGLTPNYNQNLGARPDFVYLKDSGNTEKHYIVSMFIDIKNSTNLFNRYTPETVFVVTNTIQRAAIHTCLIFGGYIHRLQGDGLFVYFGGKNIEEKESVNKSLQAASIFSYFVKNDLKELLMKKVLKLYLLELELILDQMRMYFGLWQGLVR